MLLRRVIPRNTLLRFVRAFSENTTPNPQSSPNPQTIIPEESNATADAEAARLKAAQDDQLKTINEYKEALQFFQQGKYRISNEFFKRVASKMEGTGQVGSENHVHVLKK